MNHPIIVDTEEKITDEGVTNSNVKELEKGTLLFSFKLTIGKVGFSGKLLYTNEAIAALVPLDTKDKFIKKYLYYILPHIDFSYYAQRATKGFTLNSDTMLDIEIPFPSPKEREHIVKQLDGYEKKKVKPQKEIDKIFSQQNNLIKSIKS